MADIRDDPEVKKEFKRLKKLEEQAKFGVKGDEEIWQLALSNVRSKREKKEGDRHSTRKKDKITPDKFVQKQIDNIKKIAELRAKRKINYKGYSRSYYTQEEIPYRQRIKDASNYDSNVLEAVNKKIEELIPIYVKALKRRDARDKKATTQKTAGDKPARTQREPVAEAPSTKKIPRPKSTEKFSFTREEFEKLVKEAASEIKEEIKPHYCPYCGELVRGKAKFCPYCRAKQKD